MKKYVSELLSEMGDVGMYGDDMGTHSSGGIQGLKAIFIDPFLDVAKTGQAAVAGISSKAQVLIGGLISSIISSIIPTIEQKWDVLREKDAERAQQITQKYGEVFDRTNEALWTGDGALIRFLWDPGAFITTTAIQKSPESALNLLDTLTGHNSYIAGKTDKLKSLFSKVTDTVGVSQGRQQDKGWDTPRGGRGRRGGGGGGGGMGGGYGDGGGMGEVFDLNNKNLVLEGLMSKFINWSSDKRVQQALDGSPMVKSMKKEAQSLVKEHLNDVIRLAADLSDWDSTKTLDGLTNGDFSKKIFGLEKEEQRKSAKQVASKTKQAVKKYIVDGLKGEMKLVPKPLHKIYSQAISQIQKI